MSYYVTHKYKVYGRKATFAKLDRMARDVNFVWNYCNEIAEQVSMVTPRTSYFESDGSKKVRKKYKDIPVVEVPFMHQDGEIVKLQAKAGFLSGYDLQKLTTGSSALLSIMSGTVAVVCDEYAKARMQKAKTIGKSVKKEKPKEARKKRRPRKQGRPPFLKWRGKYSRGWVPFKGVNVKFDHSTNILSYNKLKFKIRADRPICGAIRDGKFIRESDGWYISVCIQVEAYQSKHAESGTQPTEMLGIDMGLKTFLTCSDGSKIEIPEMPVVRFWGRELPADEMIASLRSYVDRTLNRNPKSKRAALAMKQIRKIEANLSRKTQHFHYNAAHSLLDKCQELVVGDLSGKFIQSVAGAKSKRLSLGLFKDRMSWIGKKRGKIVRLVDERFTTVTCSACGEHTGPSGVEGLSIRQWTCPCGAQHDRDVNAAKNIASA